MWVYIFFAVGFIAPTVLVIIWNLTHQKQIKGDLRNKQVNTPYENKLPTNYTSGQKKWTLLIAFYLLIVFIVGIFLIISGYRQLVSLLVLVAMLGWLGLIKLGNIVTK